MGLLNDIVSMIGNKMGSGQQNSLIEQAMAIITNPETGGLSGLIEKFQKNGLGDVVSSWVSTGQNKPISANQISNALGPENITQMASSAGVLENQMSDGLAGIIPQIIDKLTPDGKVPEGNLLEQSLSALAGKFLNR
jgi:uncharacterized protein YidB (DUF937 family)